MWKAIDRRNGDIVALKKIFDAFRNQTDAQVRLRKIVREIILTGSIG